MTTGYGVIGLGACTLLFLPDVRINKPHLGWKASPTCTLCNSAKLCKSFGYVEYKGDKWDCDSDEVVDVSRKGKIELHEREWGGFRVWVSCIIEGLQEIERAREGVAALMNNMWHSVLIEYGCVSSRTLWVQLSIWGGGVWTH